MAISAICYDKQDRFFLQRVNETIECSENAKLKPKYFMHPNGIIDLTTSREFRMASAILSLLDNLKANKPKERLQALENLYSEVLLMGRTKFKYNTARVLIEIIKEIVRAYGNEDLQLQLIHDFRMAATGKPNTVRKYLKRYFLLEMPEEWNQLVFDHHVHDANTKGRKSPTHLIMDAWVKGIRSLTVIYYNFVSLEAGKELIRAAEILNIKIRIGVLFNAVYGHKMLDIIWVPQSFSNVNSFESFVQQPKIVDLFEEGRQINKWKEQFIFNIIDEWNDSLKLKVSKSVGIEFSNIDKKDFSEYVGIGEGSILHLAELIHIQNIEKLTQKADEIKGEIENSKNLAEIENLNLKLKILDKLTSEYFLSLFEKCEHAQHLNMIAKIIAKEADVPKYLQKCPKNIIKKLHDLSASCTVTLNLSFITPEEVLNLLWENKGLITHLEIFNINDWHKGEMNHVQEINALMQAINNENSPNLKQIIQTTIEKCKMEEANIKSFLGIKVRNEVSNLILSDEHEQTLAVEKDSSDVSELTICLSDNTETDCIKEKIIASEVEKVLKIEHETEKVVGELIDNLYDKDNEHLSQKEQENIENAIDPDNFLCKTFNVGIYQDDPRFAPSTKEERLEKLTTILQNIVPLIEFYKNKKLYTRMGTDSTSRVGRLAGMGLAYALTLPRRARKELRNTDNLSRLRLPVRKEIKKVVTYTMPYSDEYLSPVTRILRHIPIIKRFTYKKEVSYTDFTPHTFVHNEGSCSDEIKDFPQHKGNVVTLGGFGVTSSNHFEKSNKKIDDSFRISDLNTNFKNCLKLLFGFVPAFFSFYYTQDVHLLAWFGAIIWFLITGVRNIIQAVVAGGGFQRFSLLHWNNYVSWTRLCDSLMYTGISVVLLELILRNLILTEALNITSTNAPLLTFTIMSLVNSLYIVSHNIIRGLQPEAIYGNFFRSFLAIPISLVYNSIFSFLLISFEVGNVVVIMASSSAILSKLASDTVAGLIEGAADKKSFIWLRQWDFRIATKVMYQNYSALELEFPEEDALKLLQNPENTMHILKEQNPSLYTNLILNALDFMAFYYYQPRALTTLKNGLERFTDIERLAALRLLSVLKCQRDVSQLFIDGLFGDNFSKALSFYLDKHEQYLNTIAKLYKTSVEQKRQN